MASETSPNGYAEIFLNQFRIDGHLGSFRFPVINLGLLPGSTRACVSSGCFLEAELLGPMLGTCYDCADRTTLAPSNGFTS